MILAPRRRNWEQGKARISELNEEREGNAVVAQTRGGVDVGWYHAQHQDTNERQEDVHLDK
jgi:hypothetical protein